VDTWFDLGFELSDGLLVLLPAGISRDNPAFQVYANFADSFDELDRLAHSAPERSFRIGTGELADSLAFDSITGISRAANRIFRRA